MLRQNDQINELEQNVVRIDKNGVIENEKVEIAEIKKKIVSLEIDLSNEEIARIWKWRWNKYLKEKTEYAAFKFYG